MTRTLAGRTAVITGASSGIGLAIAEQLGELGVRLALVSRSGGGPQCDGVLRVTADVRDSAALSQAMATAHQRWGSIDILVASAGVGCYGDFLSMPVDQVDEMIATNIRGTINLYRAGLPYLLGSGGGDLVTISSQAGIRGYARQAVYCASKFAQVGLSEALEQEFRDRGIRATCICPGSVATAFAMGDGRGRHQGDPSLATMLRAETVADAAVYALTCPDEGRVAMVSVKPMNE